jgi:hypothetical protein
MKQLMILVERAVRPVRADNRWKMKMRQELLAHLTAAYEEERARLGDEPAALAEASRRFGDPKELTKSLQATVPVWDRILFSNVPGTKWMDALERPIAPSPSQSPWLRKTAWAVAWALIALLLGGAAFSIFLSGSEPTGAQALAEFCAVAAGGVGIWLMFTGATCRALAGKLGVGAVLRAAAHAAVAVFTPAAAIMAHEQIRLGIPIQYAVAAPGSLLAFLGLFGLAVLVRRGVARRRLREEWTSLEIGD